MTTLLSLRYEVYSEERLVHHFHSELNAHFEYAIDQLAQSADHIIQHHPAFPEVGFSKLSRAQIALFRGGQWVYYSAPARFPSIDKLNKWANKDSAYIFQQGKATYAAVVRSNDSLLSIAWMPLKVTYPIRNTYISNYLYTGDEEIWPSDVMGLQAAQQVIYVSEHAITGISYSGLQKQGLIMPSRNRAIPWFILSFLVILYFSVKSIFNAQVNGWKASG